MNPYEWLVVEGETPEFPVFEAAKLTGASVATLQNWAARDITKLVVHNPGRAGKRMYSGHNLIIIKIAMKLMDLGLSTSHAVLVAAQIWTDALSFLTSGVKRGQERRYSDIASAIALIRASSLRQVQNVLVVLGTDNFPAADLFDGDPVVVFACGRVISEVAEAAFEARAVTVKG
jgi:hypothetical protein